jgi:hypothetical protein
MSETIILGIISSIIASSIFAFVYAWTFYQIKPNLKISPEIAKILEDGNLIYKIKVMNWGRFPITNVKAELSYVKLQPVAGGNKIITKRIHLNKSEILSLDKYDELTQDESNCYTFRTNEKLEYNFIHNNRNHLLFKIYATHSFSNFGKVKKMEYTLDSFINGDFVFGNTLDINQVI